MYRILKRVVFLLLLLVVVSVGYAAWYAFSGRFYVGADGIENPILAAAIHSVYKASLDRHVPELAAPNLVDQARIREGGEHYAEMCAGCHLAPGMDASEMRQGLNPKPPRLDDAEEQRIPAGRMFWVIKHGVRMTGMPAWGQTHSDEKIWALVTFVRLLPNMSPEQYRVLTAGAAEESEGDPVSHHP